MSKLILITGGSRCGKSSFGENLLKDQDNVLYIATSFITDDEMKQRVQIHKSKRNQKWQTYEGHRDLDIQIRETECKYLMLECISTMITNLMFDKYTDFDNLSRQDIQELEDEITSEITKFICGCRQYNKDAIIITNEVGFGLVSEYKLGRIFTDISGRVNQLLGNLCDEAYLVVSGLPLKLK